MIRCLLIQITRNARGQAVRNERLISSDFIAIGRAAECQIHLLDHRVNLHHAVIKHADDGRLFIEADGAMLSIDGRLEQNGELKPGTHILAGPYEFIVEPSAAGHDLTLTCELIHPLSATEQSAARRAPLSLSATGLSRRKPALLLAGLILLLLFVLPLGYALHPGLHKALEKLPLTPGETWNAGEMSSGHRALSTQCQTCHLQPFRAVADGACRSCHKDVANHIADAALHQRVFAEVRCSSCHLDHRGRKGLVRHDPQQCVACHGRIKARNPRTELSNVRDFSTDHPPFRLSLRVAPGPDGVKRVRQTDRAALVERSGLKYSHEVHFDKALIEVAATGEVRDIACEDCHRPDAAGAGFEPMKMEMTCQQSKCHALNFTPREAERQLPHAPVREVLTTLQEFYAGQALLRPGTDVATARGWVRAQAERNLAVLFTETGEGTCLECHEISRGTNRDEPWQVAPVDVTDHWLPKSKFPHSKHRTVKCADCHDVRHSESSAEVAIPGIAKCRECHVGSRQAKSRVSSTCDTCHGFHEVWAPRLAEDEPD